MNDNTNEGLEKDGTLSSLGLAELIVDALVFAHFLKQEDFDAAVKVATMEIDIRKHAGDY